MHADPCGKRFQSVACRKLKTALPYAKVYVIRVTVYISVFILSSFFYLRYKLYISKNVTFIIDLAKSIIDLKQPLVNLSCPFLSMYFLNCSSTINTGILITKSSVKTLTS